MASLVAPAPIPTADTTFKYSPETWTPLVEDKNKRVRVLWHNDFGNYDMYRGTITNVKGKEITIKFEDGSSFKGDPNKREKNPLISDGKRMIKEIKILDPTKYKDLFEQIAIDAALERDILGKEQYDEKYKRKKKENLPGKGYVQGAEPKIGDDHQATIPPKGKGGGSKNLGVETLNYFKDFAEYDIGANVLEALAILGGGKKKKKTRKKRGGAEIIFNSLKMVEDLLKDKNFQVLVLLSTGEILLPGIYKLAPYQIANHPSLEIQGENDLHSMSWNDLKSGLVRVKLGDDFLHYQPRVSSRGGRRKKKTRKKRGGCWPFCDDSKKTKALSTADSLKNPNYSPGIVKMYREAKKSNIARAAKGRTPTDDFALESSGFETDKKPVTKKLTIQPHKEQKSVFFPNVKIGGKRRKKRRKKRGGDGDLKEKLESIKVNKNMIIEEFKKRKKEKSIKITEPQFIKFMNSVSDDDFNKAKENLINEIIKQPSISNISRNKQGGAPPIDMVQISACFIFACYSFFLLICGKYCLSRALHANQITWMEFVEDPIFNDGQMLFLAASNFLLCIGAVIRGSDDNFRELRDTSYQMGGKRRKKTRKKRGGTISPEHLIKDKYYVYVGEDPLTSGEIVTLQVKYLGRKVLGYTDSDILQGDYYFDAERDIQEGTGRSWDIFSLYPEEIEERIIRRSEEYHTTPSEIVPGSPNYELREQPRQSMCENCTIMGGKRRKKTRKKRGGFVWKVGDIVWKQVGRIVGLNTIFERRYYRIINKSTLPGAQEGARVERFLIRRVTENGEDFEEGGTGSIPDQNEETNLYNQFWVIPPHHHGEYKLFSRAATGSTQSGGKRRKKTRKKRGRGKRKREEKDESGVDPRPTSRRSAPIIPGIARLSKYEAIPGRKPSLMLYIKKITNTTDLAYSEDDKKYAKIIREYKSPNFEGGTPYFEIETSDKKDFTDAVTRHMTRVSFIEKYKPFPYSYHQGLRKREITGKFGGRRKKTRKKKKTKRRRKTKKRR